MVAAVTIALLFVGRFVVAQIVQPAVGGIETPLSASGSGQIQPLESNVSLAPEQTVEPLESNLSKELSAKLESVRQDHPDATISVVISAMDDSFEAKLIPQQQFISASLYKTLAAYKVLQLVDAEQLSLDRIIVDGHSLRECIELAITVSDNPCGIALQSLASPYETDQQALDWGYAQTSLSGYLPTTSAQDQHYLLKDIYQGRRLSEDSQTLLLSSLAAQQITNRTPSYDDATLYLKTGDLEGAIHSSAIVETDNVTYTVSVLTDNWNDSDSNRYSVIEGIYKSVHSIIIGQAN